MNDLDDFVCCMPQMKREFRAKLPTNNDRHRTFASMCNWFQRNHPHIHLKWIEIFGMSAEPRQVILMGPPQPEIPGEATVCITSWRVKDSIDVRHSEVLKMCEVIKKVTCYVKLIFEKNALQVLPHCASCATLPHTYLCYYWKWQNMYW